MNSHHYPLKLKLRIKLKAHCKKVVLTKRYDKPSPEQFKSLNDCLDEMIKISGLDSKILRYLSKFSPKLPANAFRKP